MLRTSLLRWTGALLMMGTMAVTGAEQSSVSRLSARLLPTEEVPTISSLASGSFKAVIDEVNQTITYELSYTDLEADPEQAHIHIGQRLVNGGISVFLCANAPAGPPAGVPMPPSCPAAPATVTGVLTPAHLIGPAAQGVAGAASGANEFAELVRAMRLGATYANVHSAKFRAGEVRGQLRPGRRL